MSENLQRNRNVMVEEKEIRDFNTGSFFAEIPSKDGTIHRFYHDSHIGVSGITPVVVRCSPTGREDWPMKYEARMGFCIFGRPNCEESIGKNPFDEDYHDNYVRGIGMTEKIALRKLKEELRDLTDMLWA